VAKNKDELVFLPLGGSGEIGMNLNLYGFGAAHDRKWIMADLGVTFGNAETPGVDIIMPDTEFIEQHKDNLLGIILTHAHEDHMGALARLWPRFKCPVYCTPFTMYLVRDRLSEAGLLGEVPLHTVELGGKFKLGPFDLEMITLTHSIPEPNALAIRTPAGLILHTGDWKIDDGPVVGDPVDEAALRALGDEGILAMVCDTAPCASSGALCCACMRRPNPSALWTAYLTRLMSKTRQNCRPVTSCIFAQGLRGSRVRLCRALPKVLTAM